MPNKRPTREDGDEQPPGVEDIGSDSDSEYEEPIDIEVTNGTNPIEPEKSKTQTKGRSASRANKLRGSQNTLVQSAIRIVHQGLFNVGSVTNGTIAHVLM